MVPEHSKECECWCLMCSLSHLTRHTHTSKGAPSGSQDTNLHWHIDAAVAKYHYFISQTLTNSSSPLGSISTLWCLWAEFLFQIKSLFLNKNAWKTKLCSKCRLQLPMWTSESVRAAPLPLHTGKEKSGFTVFKFERWIKIQQIFPLTQQEKKPNSFYISGWILGKLLSLTTSLVRRLFFFFFLFPRAVHLIVKLLLKNDESHVPHQTSLILCHEMTKDSHFQV